MPRIKFYSRSNNDRQNTYVLYARVTYNGTRSEFSTKLKIEKDKFCPKTQSYNGKGDYSDLIRAKMAKIILDIHKNSLDDSLLTARDLIIGPKIEKAYSILDAVESYIEFIAPTITSGTKRNHLNKLQNLKLFERFKKRQFNHLSFDISTADSFIGWFCRSKNTSNVSTANRNVLLVRSALIHAQRQGRISSFPLFTFQGEKDRQKKPVYLTFEEFEMIRDFHFFNLTYQKIRDLFIFQCCTGLSYGDLYGNWEIKIESGKKIMVGKRVKNSNSYYVPLSGIVEEILIKYDHSLPKFTNEFFNRSLKDISMIMGIDKRITTHTARKTFATIKNGEGWTLKTISMMLGHSSTKTTESFYLGDEWNRVVNELETRSLAG